MMVRRSTPIVLVLLALAHCTRAADAPPLEPEPAPVDRAALRERVADAAPPEPEPAPVDRAALRERVAPLFGSLSPDRTSEDPEVEAARVELGRKLYFETRLSKNHDLSCNSCHALDAYGVDVRERDGRRIPTSLGHKDAFGDRNSPSTYNAFAHVAQFWDGRAEDVEAQAKGPVLNPVEMALPDAEFAVRVLRSIPGYRPLFEAAFPGEEEPVTYDNFGRAIGAFERKLVTPAPVDAFLAGQLDALNEVQLRGFELFAERCVACHVGPGFGGAIYQKIGLMKPYETEDPGRFAVTGNEDDRKTFKVPSLRNVAKTQPYLHDGSVATLDEAIALMGEYQTVQGALEPQEIADLRAFLDSLTGTLPEDLVAPPELPPSGPRTPRPDPS